MCTACDSSFDRRRFLRRSAALVGAAGVAGGLLPRAGSVAHAATGVGCDGTGEDILAFRRSGSFTTAPGASLDVAAAETLFQTPDATVSAPPIVRRSQWGADESMRTNQRAYVPVRKLIVHHSASANNPSDPAAVVRQMYRFHLQQGYTDLGYNFVIDHRGVIYEGRYSRPYAAGEQITGEDRNGWGVVGGHALGMNSASCGVVLIGNFANTDPTDAAVASLVWLLAWKAGRHRIDPLNDDPYITLFGNRTRSPNIAGHREVGQTICPARLAGRLAAIRDQVAANVGRFQPQTVDVPSVIRYELTAPPASTPAPAATPSTRLLPAPMVAGTSGQAVVTVQQALRGAGMRVAVDGAFGNQTRNVVSAFQRTKGLGATGQVDVPTLRALGLVNSTGTNVLVLPIALGSRGAGVTNVQQALAARSRRVAVDGAFGNQTRNAVAEFQMSSGIRASGIVDLNTANALGLVAARGPSATGSSTGSSTAPGSTTASAPLALPIVRGMTGDGVRAVQQALRGFGYSVPVDGTFEGRTERAVRHFQGAHRLATSGQVHAGTARALGLG